MYPFQLTNSRLNVEMREQHPPFRIAELLCLFLVVPVIFCQPSQHEIYRLYRAVAPNAPALRALLDLQVNDHLFNVDFWKEPRHPGDIADIMIPDSIRHIVERHFDENRILYNITVPDVEKLILHNEGKKRSNLGFDKRLNDDPILDSEPDDDWSQVGQLKKARYPFGDYAPYADMMKYMRTIEFYYPSFTKIVRIGTSHEGLPIEGLKIGFPLDNKEKRAIWIDGNIHAREWASSHTALYIINQLVSGYRKDDNITFYVNNLNFYIVPCLNPDGYEYTRSSPTPLVRLWRKNRSPEVCSASLWGGEKCCRGVDLNRNFDHHWAETGSSYEPCSNLFHGDYVFSEPEAASVRKFLETEEMWGKTDAFLTLHTYAQLWIYPFSHQETTYPRDIDDLRRTARKAVSRLENVYGTVYRMGTGADTLAPASGGSDDWAKSKMRVKYVYLIELRPEEHLSHGFILHKKELIPTGIETLEGLKEVFESVLAVNNIKRDPYAKISDAMKRKQEMRRRLIQKGTFYTTPRTRFLLDVTQITEAPTTRSTTSSTTTILPSTSAKTVIEVLNGVSENLEKKSFFRPTIPTAPPTFSGSSSTMATVPLTTSSSNSTKHIGEARAKQKETQLKLDQDARRKEVEETRRRVKEAQERRREEAREKKRKVEEERRKAEEIRKENERKAVEERRKEERRREEILRRQQEQWRRDNERRLEMITKQREIENRRREEERVAQEERRNELERLKEIEKINEQKHLQKEKENQPIVRVARKLVDGRIEEKEVEVLEAQPETSTAVEAVVSMVEMSVPTHSPPVTTYSPLRIPANAVTQVYARDDTKEPMQITDSNTKAIVKTKSTFAPPRITQRFDQRYTTSIPAAFRDPSCRDLRYSCAFWLQNTPQACVTQRSFMRAQCAYTCHFCQPTASLLIAGPFLEN
ncbi:unnamed protein product, partial [Mesorhabditis belari]|uniref:ShKT domain-containing protein n=1 Tax=Mesorhabditis belari TaxID=2138241 RepID=A0AAF3EVI1_9BILA